jgi:hypothetical protein
MVKDSRWQWLVGVIFLMLLKLVFGFNLAATLSRHLPVEVV